ncbi:hypothetical protein VHEMI06324 [[Torrubiella] hemipterigena]|uniref:Uncharacterized protein n=1 Tax=[Torrubiella] hemipterigena TaxID=1531966 RepID=A0A0A1T095_9HYPO|nr:hypothetical protein VHEMI06324 [[Torrubiella] hemipterigena]
MADPATPETGKAARTKGDRETLLAKLTDGNCSLDYPDPLTLVSVTTKPAAIVSSETEDKWHSLLSAARENS